MDSEAKIQGDIQLEGPKHGCILERNNSGAMKDIEGRSVRFGLGNISKKHAENMKSSDLIGITVVTVTPDMVGKKLGVFTAIEVKAPGAPKDARYRAQLNYVNWVKSRFGYGAIVDNVADFIKAIRERV